MSKTPNPEIALVVHSCDRYQLLYKGFEYFFAKYWPLDKEAYSYYFLTEKADFNSNIFTNIKTGPGEWSDRLKNGLEQIPEKYVVYLQEDMWFTKPIQKDFLKKIAQFAIDNSVKLVKLNSSEVYKTAPSGTHINGLSVSILDNAASDFLMSHQVSLWDKAFLTEQLRQNEHPWRNERKGTKRLRKLNPLIHHVDLLSENNKPPINQNADDSLQSRYFTVSVNAMLNSHIRHFIEELKSDKLPAYTEYINKLQHNYDHKITHDGKKKPRKESTFKKLKNSVKRLFNN